MNLGLCGMIILYLASPPLHDLLILRWSQIPSLRYFYRLSFQPSVKRTVAYTEFFGHFLTRFYTEIIHSTKSLTHKNTSVQANATWLNKGK